MRFHATAQVLALLLLTGNAMADTAAFLPNDPKRPVEQISHDLDITAAQFVACFEHVSPAPSGEHPSAEKVHANKSVLLACLQKANPNITNDGLDTVMDRYRPGGNVAPQSAQ